MFLQIQHIELLELIHKHHSAWAERAADGTLYSQIDKTDLDLLLSEGDYADDDRTWLRRTLNQLRNEGLVSRYRSCGYCLSPEGIVAIQGGAK